MARHREFDTELVLNAARDLFWQRGYRGTSLDAVSELTGVKKPSLYAAFGDKSQLFLIILDRYHQFLLAVASQMLGGQEGGRQAIKSWLFAFVPYCSGEEGARGCLSVNTSIEASELVPEVRQRLQGYQQALQSLLRDALARAVQMEELPPTFPCEQVAKLLLIAQSGFMVMARGAPDSDSTHAAMAQLLDALMPETLPVHAPSK